MLKADVFAAEKPPCQDTHDCLDFTVLTADNEMVCVRCGKVNEEETARFVQENDIKEGRERNAKDHNAGNGLLDSQTVQSKFVSMSNPGVAMLLNHPRGKDAQGKRIKPQLKDPYKAGLLADPSVGYHVETDVLTGKSSVKFSRYDAPLLPFIKEKALQRSVSYKFDTVEQTLISQEIKRLYSTLVLSPIVNYIVVASLLKYRHLLPKSERTELEQELAKIIEDIRGKLITGCQKSKCP